MSESPFVHFELQIVRVDLDSQLTGNWDGLYVEVEINLNKVVYKIQIGNGGKADGNATLSLPDLPLDTILEIRLKKLSRLWTPVLIASTHIAILDLFRKYTEDECRLSLTEAAYSYFFTSRQCPTSIGNIVIAFKALDTLARVEIAVKIAQWTANKGVSAGNAIMKSIVRAMDEIITVVDEKTQFDLLLPLASRAALILNTIVWKLFTTDPDLLKMADEMKLAYDVSNNNSNNLNMSSTQIRDLLVQTANCTRFLQWYGTLSLLDRMEWMDYREKIVAYTSFFKALRQNDSKSLLGTTANEEVIDRAQVEQELRTLRKVLHPFKVEGDDVPDHPRCLDGTRSSYLDLIMESLSAKTSPSVIWLTGDLGTGTSTIAATILDRCSKQELPVCSLFFERELSDHATLIPTIAYQLASLCPYTTSRILQAAVANRSVMRSGSVKLQFERLLLKPLRDFERSGTKPIIIILDALDECGGLRQQPHLLRSLIRGFGKLPPGFRFLITSRSEPGTMASPLSQDEIRVVNMCRRSDASQEDIKYYIAENVKDISGGQVHQEEGVKLLSNAADGLFIWASLMVQLTSTSFSLWLNAKSPLPNLGGLYEMALLASGIRWEEEGSKRLFVEVMGLIAIAKEPLTIGVIEAFLDLERGTTEGLLQQLGNLLSYEPERAIRLRHASFAEYLMSKESSGNKPWYIDRPGRIQAVTERCFDIMRMLRPNICNIKSSFVLNKDIEGIEERVKANVKPHQDYACRFWADHMCNLPRSTDGRDWRSLLSKLADFVNFHTLQWFEVLSLEGCFDCIAARALLDASVWTMYIDKEISSTLWAAYRLALTFGYPMSQSVPHIYISAMSVWVAEPRIADGYSEMYPAILVDQFGRRKLVQCARIIEEHAREITSVAVSPDNLRIASCSADGTIRIWDVASGEPLSDSFEGHTGAVLSVAFSPDGNRVASCSDDKTIRVWDAVSGEPVSGPFEGHSGSVTAVSFSHDGKRIVSGSADRTICVWDAESGSLVHGPLEGHSQAVTSVAFSPTSSAERRYIVSGSCDCTIRIWDSITGNCVMEPGKEHTGEIWSVSFSPDGRRVASGSEDRTIRIWCVETGKILLQSAGGRTSPVTAISYTPGGERIVSGSRDGSIHVYDANNGRLVLGPFIGHSDTVTSVAFLPLSRSIVSSCNDMTIRVWNVYGDEATASTQEHTAGINSVSFTPNGRYIVSGSRDKTIRVWRDDGVLMFDPLKGHFLQVTSVCVSPNGRLVVSGSRDGTLLVWDVNNGRQVLGPLRGHTDWVTSVTYAHDGATIISGSADKTIRVWQAGSGEPLSGPLIGHTSRVTCVRVSPDRMFVASSSEDGTICIWHLYTSRVVSRLSYSKSDTDAIWSVGYSPDGRQIASGSQDGVVRIWDLRREKLTLSIKGHAGAVNSVSYSPDGKFIASGSDDRTVCIWDASNGALAFGPLEGHTAPVTSISYSPGGRIASGSADRTIRIWDVSMNLGDSDEERSILDWTLSEDGWIRGQGGGVIAWIPEDRRDTLWRPLNAAVLGCQFSSRLKLKPFILGENWYRSFPIT